MQDVVKSLNNMGYDYEDLNNNIYLIKNFLQEEEVENILSYIMSASEKDWETHYMDGVLSLAERKYGRTDIDNLVQEGLIEITHHWVDKNLSLPHWLSEGISIRVKEIFDPIDNLIFDGVGTIQRQYSGAQLTEHVDNHADPFIEYAVIMYINDDYVDGELFFRKLGLKIKPERKSMIIFPSGEDYLHGVMPPGDGPMRYVLPSFVRRKN